MKRNLLILRIFCAVLLLATLGIFVWETARTLATPSQDDIFGHAGTVFVTVLIALPILIGEWEFYRGMNYFLDDSTRTKANAVSNAIAVGLSGLMLAISGVTYLFFMEKAILCVYYMWLTGGLLVFNRLATSVCIAWNAPEEESVADKIWRIFKIVVQILILIPVGFGCFIGLLFVFTMLEKTL